MKRSLLFIVLLLPLIAFTKPAETLDAEILDYIRQRIRIVQTSDAAALHQEEIEVLERSLTECSSEELQDCYGPFPRKTIKIKLSELQQQEPNLFRLARLRSELDSLFLRRINKVSDDINTAKLSAEIILRGEEYYFQLSYDGRFIAESPIYEDVGYSWEELICTENEKNQIELFCRYIERDDWEKFCNCLSDNVALWHEQHNPLFVAVHHRRIKYVRKLLEAGASPDWFAVIPVENEPLVTTMRESYIHEYAYALRARDILKEMKRLAMYEKKLALDVVQPGPRPVALSCPWRKGSDMDEIKFLLWDDGVCTQDNSFFGYQVRGLWSFNEDSGIVRIYSTQTDLPIKTPKYEFKYDPEKETLILSGTGEVFRKSQYPLIANEREKFFKRKK